jgi:hypothetical protein
MFEEYKRKYDGDETTEFVYDAEQYDVEVGTTFAFEQELKYLCLFVLGFCIGYWVG